MRFIYSILGIALLATACNKAAKEDKKEQEAQKIVAIERHDDVAIGTRQMERTVPHISAIRSREELSYAIEHYWDGFNFDAGERVAEYDTVDMCRALVDYAALVMPTGDFTPMRRLIERAEASRPVLDYFMTITDMVLNDPNSPMRNDELYIPILERLVESPLLDEYDRLIPQRDLERVMQNRIGKVANDFKYTLADGTTGKLHDIEANYTLVMFNNPDCPMCRMIIDDINASPMLNELQELGRLQVVTLYPDADLEAWRRNLDHMPRRWIVAYDDGCVITEQRSYDLRAIPSLYLLDAKKRVLIKDGTDVRVIEEAITYYDTRR